MTNRKKLDTPAVHIPPPVIMVVFLVLGLYLNKVLGSGFGAAARPFSFFGIGFIVFSAILVLWCGWLYHKAKTSISPYTKDNAIIDTGPFGVSRNPIYVSMIMMFIGIVLYWNAPAALLLLIPTYLALRYYAIAREEAYLFRRFGKDYTDYQARVRRWF
ncbi:MAG: isoprenylcysteine carboxylmethyltransferase family protein [Robiginitomaculum sp.]